MTEHSSEHSSMTDFNVKFFGFCLDGYFQQLSMHEIRVLLIVLLIILLIVLLIV